jgi:uncharacterized protein YoxC
MSADEVTVLIAVAVGAIPTISAAISVWMNIRKIRQDNQEKESKEKTWQLGVNQGIQEVLMEVKKNREDIAELSEKLEATATHVADLRERVAVLESENNIWKSLYRAAKSEPALAKMVKP